MKEPLARKPHDFEKLRSPTNAGSDWRGAGSVDYLSLETSINRTVKYQGAFSRIVGFAGKRFLFKLHWQKCDFKFLQDRYLFTFHKNSQG